MKKKGNKKMPRPRQEIIDNPIPTSLFFNKNCLYTFTSVPIYPKIATPVSTNNRTAAYHINKDVGTGLSMISCLGLGIFLIPFFFKV